MAVASVPWRTEALVYRSDLAARLPDGLVMPAAHGVFDLDEGSASIWLEEVAEAPVEVAWDLDRFRLAAHLLGRLAASPGVSELADVGRDGWTVCYNPGAYDPGANVRNSIYKHLAEDANYKYGSTSYYNTGYATSKKAEDVDLIILEGGVNDAWGATDGSGVYAPVGRMTDSFDVKDYDITTFAGGLEELFYYANEQFPNAQIVYISMFYMPKAPASINRVSDMEEYYAEAEKICEKWGVAYLDLYHNEELSTKLCVEQESSNYLRDPVHPNANGYDVMTPYIAEFLESLAK
jgi:lysophospholipase L1-like esterase